MSVVFHGNEWGRGVVDIPAADAHESFLRNGYVQTHGLEVFVDWSERPYADLSVINSRGAIANGFVRAPADAFAEMCRDFLQLYESTRVEVAAEQVVEIA